MPIIPSNSNLTLLLHAINKAPDSDAMEMFIFTGLVHYCQEMMRVDLNQFEEDSEEFCMAYNFKQLADILLTTIHRKHSPTLKESDNGADKK